MTKKENMLRKLKKCEKKAQFTEKHLKGPGLLKKIKRLFFWRQKYFLHVFSLLVKSIDKKAKLFFGKEIVVPIADSIAFSLYRLKSLNFREMPLTKFFIKNAKKEDVFYDIGANYGFYSFLCQEIIHNEGEIHAFEPNKKVFKYLKLNIGDGKKFYLNKKAVSNKNGEIVFFNNLNNSATSSIIPSKNIDNKKNKEKVKSITLDKYVQNHTAPTIIKIDVEGAEEKVLLGGKKFLKNNSPIISLEVWEKDRGRKYHLKAINFLKKLGYSMFRIKNDGELEKIEKINFDKMTGFKNFIFKK